MGSEESRALRGRGEPLTIGYVGRFHPKKNLGLLIRAVAQLPANVTLRVAGAGSEDAERDLDLLIASEGLIHRVERVGFLAADERNAFLRDLDLLVMPSAYECFGMAAAEALAAGIPVVVSRGTGIAALVAETDAGAVICPTLDSLCASLTLFASSDEVRARWRENARTVGAGPLTFERYGRSLLASYGLN